MAFAKFHGIGHPLPVKDTINGFSICSLGKAETACGFPKEVNLAAQPLAISYIYAVPLHTYT